jgi:hypothetical protein
VLTASSAILSFICKPRKEVIARQNAISKQVSEALAAQRCLSLTIIFEFALSSGIIDKFCGWLGQGDFESFLQIEGIYDDTPSAGFLD